MLASFQVELLPVLTLTAKDWLGQEPHRENVFEVSLTLHLVQI